MKNNKKIIHIGENDKFLPKFIELTTEHFDNKTHYFYLKSGLGDNFTEQAANVFISKRSVLERIVYYLRLVHLMHNADKVMLHGLFDIKIVMILFLNPWLLKKCYWFVWGGDLYCYLNKSTKRIKKFIEFARASVIKKIGHFVSYVDGDYHLASEWYKTRAKYHFCFMYPSNLYHEVMHDESQKITTSNTVLLIGNSADPSNNHLEIFEKIEKHQSKSIEIYCPLSYGDMNYRELVIQEGLKRFGDNFIPIKNLMPINEYLELLNKIDLAIFAHDRQQAMGNTITLLGMGKKVFIKNTTTTWQLFDKLKIKVFDINQIDLNDMPTKFKTYNRLKIKETFSEATLIKQLSSIYTQ